MKNEAAFGHEECGKEGSRVSALRFIYHGGAATASYSRSEWFIVLLSSMKNLLKFEVALFGAAFLAIISKI